MSEQDTASQASLVSIVLWIRRVCLLRRTPLNSQPISQSLSGFYPFSLAYSHSLSFPKNPPTKNKKQLVIHSYSTQRPLNPGAPQTNATGWSQVMDWVFLETSPILMFVSPQEHHFSWDLCQCININLINHYYCYKSLIKDSK